jgi:hypothetical protein
VDRGTAVKILKSLFDGIDPFTGEIYDRHSPYQHPDTLRALSMAVEAIEKPNASGGRRGASPAKAGKPWTDDEDKALVRAFDQGLDQNALARDHERTRSAIRARLIRLGKISP